MSRISDKQPYVTTFRRKVRTLVMPASADLPLDVIQGEMRAQLHEGKHTVVENSWQDAPGYYSLSEFRAFMDGGPSHRTVRVRYVTGGMRHGLGESIELQPQVAEIEFARAHGPGFGR